MVSAQARYWLLTIPEDSWNPEQWENGLPAEIAYCTGQKEVGDGTGYVHWQVLVAFTRKVTRTRVKSFFGSRCHAEASRSEAARAYVRKEETRVPGTDFEFGQLAVRRNAKPDWDTVWDCAVAGRLLEVEVSLRIQHYNALRRIASDYGRADMVQRTVSVFIGPTGTGKSHRAWTEAGLEAYPKSPTTKFWDGYNGQRHGILN